MMPDNDVTMGLAQRQAYVNGAADAKRARPDFRAIERELVEFFETKVAVARAGGTPIIAVASTRVFYSKDSWQVTTGEVPLDIQFVDLPELARRLADLWK